MYINPMTLRYTGRSLSPPPQNLSTDYPLQGADWLAAFRILAEKGRKSAFGFQRTRKVQVYPPVPRWNAVSDYIGIRGERVTERSE